MRCRTHRGKILQSLINQLHEFMERLIYSHIYYISSVEREPKEAGRDKAAQGEGEGAPGGMSK